MASTKSDLSKRRRFQPPITTFFTTSSDPNSSSSPSHLSYNHYSAVTNSPTPVVPAKVQASLLSVGMRVRKSIADGYKTHQGKADKYTTFSCDNANNDTPKPTITTATIYNATIYNSDAPVRSELAPFCGMSKSDEYTCIAPQPLPTAHHYHHIITTEEDDAFSIPPSSQESVDSTLEPTAHKKRTRHDFDFDPYDDEDDEMDPVHPHSGTNISGRTILSPKASYQCRTAQIYKAGQTMDLDDFEEPSFLRRRDEVEGEIQMGGI
ncbi:uncharacterized protein DSM5745_01893 [Aspergillus mulundensis]|uniref:Uncharacterized protein n=1 Tax=Aspergillus mulundensis TaxID=1810919 RepID=A0A3D8SWE9_9EURO|nr:Uncharacterized protein DSM5745_01893 [Aspergillus mulundensis]RDW90118.1 Uncharacterized protein DSM5745_01893 [Aspergillus mulundensis]